MTDEKINDLIEILKNTVNGKCSIFLAGAHAKGTADDDSDIDLFMFIEEPKSYDKRLAIIKSAADIGTTPWVSYDFNEAPWGGTMDFCYKGTPVETTIRTFSKMRQGILDCLDGKFEIVPATWTSNGYYTFIYLSELSFIKPIFDPDETIRELQRQIVKYPQKLKKSIIDCFLGRANTWLDNFHYQSAIKRKDILFTGPIVMHTVLDMIQVIFALNEVYYTGDKKLEPALSILPYCPESLLENIDLLMSSPRSKGLLEKQHQILLNIRDELIIEAKRL